MGYGTENLKKDLTNQEKCDIVNTEVKKRAFSSVG